MLDEEEYSSDTSDDDYAPCGAESDASEASSGNESAESDPDDEATESSSKKKTGGAKKGSKKKKSSKAEVQGSPVPDQTSSELNKSDDPKRVEDIWSSFKKDVEKPTIKSETVQPEPPKVISTQVFEFAGEKVSVTKEEKVVPSTSTDKPMPGKRPPMRTGGLSGLASQLSGNKKQKLSVLEKSKLDWDTFKQDEGITEDLKTFNQGKMGFLERQAFLERADVKQFEIEKNFRAGRKKLP